MMRCEIVEMTAAPSLLWRYRGGSFSANAACHTANPNPQIWTAAEGPAKISGESPQLQLQHDLASLPDAPGSGVALAFDICC